MCLGDSGRGTPRSPRSVLPATVRPSRDHGRTGDCGSEGLARSPSVSGPARYISLRPGCSNERRETMDDRVLSPEDARERLAAWKGRIDRLATDTKAMSDRFQRLQVTRKDANGMTEVTVDSSGSLVAL